MEEKDKVEKTEEVVATTDKAETTEPAIDSEQTIGEVIDEVSDKPEQKERTTVPEAAFLDEKKGRKEAERRVKELERLISQGGERSEIKADIEDIAKKHNVDSDFLREFASSIEASLKKDTSDELSKKLRPIEERDRQDRIDKAFEQHFAIAMDKLPEFKNIVNRDAIKTLTLDPRNSKKTFSQIIEETYGSAIPGRRTIEQNRPGGSKEPAEIDYDRAKSDGTYFKELMADPSSKKKYNDGLLSRIERNL